MSDDEKNTPDYNLKLLLDSQTRENELEEYRKQRENNEKQRRIDKENTVYRKNIEGLEVEYTVRSFPGKGAIYRIRIEGREYEIAWDFDNNPPGKELCIQEAMKKVPAGQEKRYESVFEAIAGKSH